MIYGFHPLKRWRYRHIPGPPPKWLIGAFGGCGQHLPLISTESTESTEPTHPRTQSPTHTHTHPHNHTHTHKAHCQGPRLSPNPCPAGNLDEIRRLGQETAYVEWAKRFGPVFVWWFGARPVVVVEDAAAGRQVLRANASRKEILVLNSGDARRFLFTQLVFQVPACLLGGAACLPSWRGCLPACLPAFLAALPCSTFPCVGLQCLRSSYCAKPRAGASSLAASQWRYVPPACPGRVPGT